ncbi:MAG: SAM-dependent methyltransferase [Phycisphaerae bacterium]|nr:SAM-dependent methyltransferase [Phycisphaerae bacterium]
MEPTRCPATDELPPDSIELENRRFYDPLWRHARLYDGDRFNTWALIRPHVEGGSRRLEIGPGLRPRLPVSGTTFVDLSPVAVERLRKEGATVHESGADSIPIKDGSMDLVGAFDVIEHVTDDQAVFDEISRVLRPGGSFFLSVPLHADAWSDFDRIVGHCRRYDPVQLEQQLCDSGFEVLRSAPYGLRHESNRFACFGLWFLRKFPAFSMWCYNNFYFPIVVRKQEPLQVHDGMINDPSIDELVIECRKRDE